MVFQDHHDGVLMGASFSIIIVTKDISPDITPIFEQCLMSVSDIDDVWVVHSGKGDHIEQIATRYNVIFMPYIWNGQYPKKRQWCLDHVPTKHDWVFFLDADELMFPALCSEIEKTLQNSDTKDYAGFFVRGGYIWDGTPLKYGLKNNKITLLHKKRMHYPVIDDLTCEAMGEIEGHYQPVPVSHSYKIGQLSTTVDHYAFIDDSDWHKRHKKYAIWEAYMIRHNAYPIDPSPSRQLMKSLFRQLPARPVIAFLHCYIWKLGFLDGSSGLAFAKTRYKYYRMVRRNIQNNLGNI